MSGDGFKGRRSLDARKKAKRENLVIKTPLNNELFIDIDTDADLAEYDRNYGVIDELYGIDETYMTASRTKPEGKHIVVTLSQCVTPTERIMLQAILGSDRTREALSLWRVRNNDPDPTLFFELSTSAVPLSTSTSDESAESSPTASGETLSADPTDSKTSETTSNTFG
jgi:hypothetical protein